MKLGEVITLNKDLLINIENNTQYTIAGVQSYGKGILNKRIVQGHELTMKKYKVIKPNQLMWCKVDTKNGAFGITNANHKGSLASTNMALADIDIQKAEPQFIELLFRNKWFYKTINSKSKGTTNRKYLKPREVCDLIEIPNLNLQEQLDFVKLYNKISECGLNNEVVNQKVLVGKLRQAILQEAVQGKLTVKWREENPSVDNASELLKRIEAEKQQLIAEKKIKKQKVFSEINKDETPYELPNKWTWCRLNDLLGFVEYPMKRGPFGSALRKDDFVSEGIRVFEQYNPINDDPHWARYYITPEKYEVLKAFDTGAGDLLISCSGATLGRITELPEGVVPGIINQALLKLSLHSDLIYNRYFVQLFRSSYIQVKIWKKALGSAIPNMVGVVELKEMLIPLPPPEEQLAVLEKVNSLMALCDELEQQVDNSQSQIEQLLQSCLKEVFEQESN